MVKALYSYDLTRQAKALAICIAVVFVYAVVALILPYRFQSLHTFQYFLIFLVLSISFINLVNLVFQVYLIYDYNKTMYGAQGILTNILPMDTGSVIIAKSLSIMTVKILIDIALAIFSVVITVSLIKHVDFTEYKEIEAIFLAAFGLVELGVPVWYLIFGILGLCTQAFYTAAFIIFVCSVANLPSFKKYKLLVLIVSSLIVIIVCAVLMNLSYLINVGFSQELLFDSNGMLTGFGPLKFSHNLSVLSQFSTVDGLTYSLSSSLIPDLVMFILAIILMATSIYLAAHKLRIK